MDSLKHSLAQARGYLLILILSIVLAIFTDRGDRPRPAANPNHTLERSQ